MPLAYSDRRDGSGRRAHRGGGELPRRGGEAPLRSAEGDLSSLRRLSFDARSRPAGCEEIGLEASGRADLGEHELE